MMRKICNFLSIAFLSLFVNNSLFAAGPRVELIAADQSSHVCKIGVYAGWNVLSGTSSFNKLVEFRSESYQVSNEKLKFKADWLNYDIGTKFGYTRFFDRVWGWNVLDAKIGYNQYATFSLPQKEKIANSFKYSGFSIDLMSGIAFNLWEDGLDFEEGNQFGERLVFNVNGGVNLNYCSFTIKGEAAFKERYLDAHFADTSQLFRAILEPSIEWVLSNGFYSKFALNIRYFGPWKAEKNHAEYYHLEPHKVEKLPNTLSLAPICEFGWDFSALIN